jgi:pimeloyl-ACP methyl ester carboxylesterase
MVAELGALGYTGVLMWGRSMGGVSAVLYYSRFRNPIIKGIVLDSPFCSF